MCSLITCEQALTFGSVDGMIKCAFLNEGYFSSSELMRELVWLLCRLFFSVITIFCTNYNLPLFAIMDHNDDSDLCGRILQDTSKTRVSWKRGSCCTRMKSVRYITTDTTQASDPDSDRDLDRQYTSM